MNLYNEILNKCAAFLGYEGIIKADEKHIMKEIERLKKLLMVNDDLENIDKSYINSKNKLGRTIFVCYNNGSAYITKGKPVSPDTNLNMIVINRIYENKEPCICFVIEESVISFPSDSKKIICSWGEITIDEVMKIIER